MAPRKKKVPNHEIELPPEWLISQHTDGRSYVMHTKPPVFVCQIHFGHDGAHYRLPSGFGLGPPVFYGKPPLPWVGYRFIVEAEQLLLNRYCPDLVEARRFALTNLGPCIGSTESDAEQTVENENWPERVWRLAARVGGIAALAREMGCSRRTLTRYCNGSRTPRGLYNRRLLEFEGRIRAGR